MNAVLFFKIPNGNDYDVFVDLGKFMDRFGATYNAQIVHTIDDDGPMYAIFVCFGEDIYRSADYSWRLLLKRAARFGVDQKIQGDKR